MKIKILGAHQHLNSQPTYDEQGRQTGTTQVPLMQLILIPDGDDPQRACMRIDVQIYDPDDASLVKFRPGRVLDMGEITTAAAEAANQRTANAAE